MLIKSLEVDEDGYPNEMALDLIRALDKLPPEQGKAWQDFMTHDFERLAAELPYATCWSEPAPDNAGRRLIHFATGGWSGCEDFIDAVLSIRMVRLMYHYAWKRGGLWTFEVPVLADEAA